MKFSWGSDPEFMFQKNGKICSAIGVLMGDKEDKYKVDPFEFYYDNVLGECTLPPSYSKEETIQNIKNCLQIFSKIIAPCELIIKASHKYEQNQLEHEDALKVYCVPENCCYSMDEVESDDQIFRKINLRSAGGHIHLGNPMLREEYNGWVATRLMDLFLGIPSVLLDKDLSSKTRKEIYGKSGRFRFTSYGIEYRSLSNFWLIAPELVSLIYDISSFVLETIESGLWKELWFIDYDKINDETLCMKRGFRVCDYHIARYNVAAMREAIDTCNLELASEFMPLIQKYLPKEIFSKIESLSNSQFNFKKEWEL